MKTHHSTHRVRMTARSVGVAAILSFPLPALGFTGGDGSAGAPYQVATAEHLDDVRNHLGAHFVQTAHIDLGAAPWNVGGGWVPVGSSSAAFTGHYDGGGFTIANLTIQRTAGTYQGLFGSMNGATVRDLSVTGAQVTGYFYTGILVGSATNSWIEAVSTNGSVSASQSYSGGLAGQMSGGLMHRAHSNAVIQGKNLTGGLIGHLTNLAEIRHSSARGTVAGGDDVGGLVGQMGTGSTNVFDCFSHASATGDVRVGGLVGFFWTGRINRSYSSGAVSGPEGVATIGGFIGQGGDVADCFWDLDASGQESSAGGKGLTTLEMRNPASFRHFNFHTLWEMDDVTGYPVFRDFSTYAPPASVALESLAGRGTPETPYIVTNADELNAMRLNLTARYRLGNHIDLRDTVLWDMGRGWSPVGTSTSGQRFVGRLDGAGFTISHLAINRPMTGYQGLIGSTDNGAVIENLQLAAANIHNGGSSGLLAGQAISSRIEKVAAEGTLVSQWSRVGALVGNMNGGVMHRTHSNAVIQGGNEVGGLVGYLVNHGEIRHSSARGTVAGGNDVGGFVGHMYGGSQFVSDCYSRASVTGNARVGGLIGYLWSGAAYRSYSSGVVSGPEGVSSIGGLTGAGTNVRDCFWDIDASGRESSAGGEGLATLEMQDPASFRHFNFHTLWEREGATGYPVFRDFSTYAPPVSVALESLGGRGTPENPYIVTNANQLNAMRLNPTAKYRLGNHIDLRDTVLWDMGRGWSPVGEATAGQQFTGGLDGAGFVISHLAVNRPLSNDQALIGYTNGAALGNLRVEKANLQSNAYSGLLAGRVVNSQIEMVSIEGTLVTGGVQVGALAGSVSGGLVHRAFSNAVVQGIYQIGGLVGYLTNGGEIRHSTARGTVTGGEDAGGLVGHMYGGSQFVSDCYSRASVTGNARVGGLIGYLWAGAAYRSYSSGFVGGPEGVATIGGLTGQGANVRDCFWDVETSGRVGSAGGEGLTTARMQDPASFRNYNFHTLWKLEVGGYPDFQDFSGYVPPTPVALESLGGSGTEELPYILTNTSELHAMQLDLTAHYRLDNDIDLRDVVLWDMGRGWSPVGTSTSGQHFTGTLDGAGFRISHLAVNRPAAVDQGLLGYLDGATVENLRVEMANIHSGGTSGLLAGQARNSLIAQVSVLGVVRSSSSQVGGMVGLLSGGNMHQTHGNTMVRGGNQVGGLAGYLTNSGQIRQSSARGSVTGNQDVGGLVGQMMNGSQIVADCYSRAVVSGETRVGGLVGYIWAGSVTRSHSTGLVSPASKTSTQLGGLSGLGSNVQLSYWDMQTSGHSTSGGGLGRTTAEMTHPHASNTYVDWDFADVWSADTAGTLNGGYPYLQVSGANPQAGGPFTLTYHAGPGGVLEGPSPQTVAAGQSGSAMFALAEAGAVFIQWSDGSTANPRTDGNVQADLAVMASFRSTGGVDIDWYAGHGIARTGEETWADLDNRDEDGDGQNNAAEFAAGTNPLDPQSRFFCEPPVLTYNPNLVSSFPESAMLRWSSVPGKYYHIEFSTDLQVWQIYRNYAGNPLLLPASDTDTTTEWNFPVPLVEPGQRMMFRIVIAPQE